METGDKTNRGRDTDDRVPDERESNDTDRVTRRTEVPRSDRDDLEFDVDAPGNFVDDTHSANVPEPNEPA